MNEYLGRAGSVPIGREEQAIDPGLRKFMLGVYVKMGWACFGQPHSHMRSAPSRRSPTRF